MRPEVRLRNRREGPGDRPFGVSGVNPYRWLWVFGLAGLMLACQDSRPNFPTRAVPTAMLKEPAARAAGKELFLRLCASCHGHPSEGRSERADFFQPPAPDFSSEAYRTIDPAYLYWRIEKGKTVEPYLSAGSVMPSWGPHLSSRQIWQLVAYLRTRPGQ